MNPPVNPANSSLRFKKLGTSPPYYSLSIQETASPGLINVTVPGRDAATGELITQEFYEKPHHGGSIDFLAPVDWKEKIPGGVGLNGASAGQNNDMNRIYWVSWIDANTISALAITQENPISVPLIQGDQPIHSPIQNMDKKFRIHFWRKQKGKHTLLTHVFSGEGKQPGSVLTEKVLEINYDPLFTTAVPVPSVFELTGFRDNGMAVIGWLSTSGSEMRAHAIWMEPHHSWRIAGRRENSIRIDHHSSLLGLTGLVLAFSSQDRFIANPISGPKIAGASNGFAANLRLSLSGVISENL